MEIRPASDYTWSNGAIIRAPRERKRIALVFTGGEFGEGLCEVLDTLRSHAVPASFYFTGDFFRNPEHHPGIERLLAGGHLMGPHSDAHPLYCPWDDRAKTLVTREEFTEDLERNLHTLEEFGVRRDRIRWWIPPYEWYNEEIARWSLDAGLQLFNFTPGTLSNADYTTEDAKNYRDSETIYQSILAHEERDPDGLSGFLMLVHVGAGPGRLDKFYRRLDALITELLDRGYTFERVDTMLERAPSLPE